MPADGADFSTTCRGSDLLQPGTGLPGTQRFQDKEVVRAAVQNCGMALEFASEALRGDKELESLVSQVGSTRAGNKSDPRAIVG